MSRTADIVRLRPITANSVAEQVDQQDVLRRVLGRTVAIVEFLLQADPLGHAFTAGDPIETARTLIDVTDAFLQQWRVIADGSGAGASVDVTVGGTSVGAAALAGSRSVVASDWTVPQGLGTGDLMVAASVAGAGATLYAVRLQARTVRAPTR